MISPTVIRQAGVVIGRLPSRSASLAREPETSVLISIGERTELGAHAVIFAGTEIGDDCLIGDHAIIREGCRIGDLCIIGQKVSLDADVEMGSRVRVMTGSHIAGGMVIGDDTFIGVNVTTSNDRGIEPLNYHFEAERLKPPVIGRGVFIGSGANILPGVTIGDGAVVGAGALVAHDIPAGRKLIASTDRKHVVL